MNYEQKFIEIPFGANDSELKGWEYTIPEGMEAIVKDGKVIVREKESEHEKALRIIKKRMRYDPVPISDEDRRIVENWLEKKKGQKVDIDKLRRDIYQSGYNDGYQHGKEDAQKEQQPDLEFIQRSWYMEGYIDGEFKREPRWNLKAGKGGPKYEENEKYGQPLEQKPAEWSEEDVDMLNSCISSIEEAKENRYAYKETDGDTSYDHEIAWLKSLRPKRVNVSDQTLQLLICYLYGCHDVAKRDWEKADCRRYISYLEDLDYTLKNRWKPSEEQMEELGKAKDMYMKSSSGIASLYYDLKTKLM